MLLNERVEAFSQGKLIIYLLTRLFSFNDRLLSADLWEALYEGVCRGLHSLGLPVPPNPIFVPFRDTKQDLINSSERSKIIYEADIERMNRLFACIGFLESPSKDPGIGMEVGYAYGKGVPTILLNTDFIWYRSLVDSNVEFMVDPVVDFIMSRIIHVYRMCDVTQTTDALPTINEYYRERLVKSKQSVLSLASDIAKDLVVSYDKYIPKLPITSGARSTRKVVYVDFAGGKYEWAQEYMRRISEKLRTRNVTVSEACRHARDQGKRVTVHGGLTSNQLGWIDIQHCLEADIVVVGADGQEMDIGTSAIHGLAAALDKKIIMYYSGSTECFGDGQQVMYQNLMLDHSASCIAREMEEVVAHLMQFLA